VSPVGALSHHSDPRYPANRCSIVCSVEFAAALAD
jgi:hypothetical protein